MKTSCALVLLSTALPFCVAYIEEPPTTADANTVSDCSWWVVAATGDTCTAIAEDWSISVSDFELVYVSLNICNTFTHQPSGLTFPHLRTHQLGAPASSYWATPTA